MSSESWVLVQPDRTGGHWGCRCLWERAHLKVDCDILAGAHKRGHKPSREGALHVVVGEVQVQRNLLIVVDGWA